MTEKCDEYKDVFILTEIDVVTVRIGVKRGESTSWWSRDLG
jgi:hypothetical protein